MAQKKPKMAISCMLNQYKEILKILNFTTTNAIMMKFTTDTYLNMVFNLEKSFGVTQRV